MVDVETFDMMTLILNITLGAHDRSDNNRFIINN